MIDSHAARVAYAVQRGEKWVMVVDGVEGKEYDSMGWMPPRDTGRWPPIFSPDGRRFAYVAECGAPKRESAIGPYRQASKSGNWVVVTDYVEGPEYGAVFNLVWSPDGKRIAYRASREARQFVLTGGGEAFYPETDHLNRVEAKDLVVVDGVEGKAYDDIRGDPVFSPDGTRVGYAAVRGKRHIVIVDGQEGKEYDAIAGLPLIPGGNRGAYMVRRGPQEGQLLVVLGAEGLKYDEVIALTFSPDGKRVTYTARRGPKQLVVTDGVEGKEYDVVGGGEPTLGQDGKFVLKHAPRGQDAGDPFFSPDGKRVAYVACRGAKQLAVVDSAEGQEYDAVVALTFSPNAKRVAYAARRGARWMVVLDGKEGREFDAIDEGSIRFSRDSMRTVYVATRAQKRVAVIDGVEGREYDNVSRVVFSPNGKRTAYVVRRGQRQAVVLDGEEQSEWDDIECLRFSPDGRRIAYAARRDEKRYVVVDEVPSEGYGDIGGTLFQAVYLPLAEANRLLGDSLASRVVFSADSRRVAYVARDVPPGKSFLVVDGEPANTQYGQICQATISFSPNGRHVAYMAVRNEKSVLVVDGVESNGYDEMLYASPIGFDGSKRLHTVAKRDGEYFRLDVEIVRE